jgi:DNA helicase HerA-like ATPase
MIENEFHNISSILKIGNVFSVEGRVIKIRVDRKKNSSHLLYKGKAVKNIAVGSYIKIVKGFEVIYGKIEGEYIKENFSASSEYIDENEKIDRILIISLLGFLKKGKFERGIKELPLIDNEAYLVIGEEILKIHDFISSDDKPISFGTLALEKNQTISFGINKLFASHIGIFGNTGSGKSYTLSKVYNELFVCMKDNVKFHKNSKLFLFDFNGEYVETEKKIDNVIVDQEYKESYILSTYDDDHRKFPLPESALKDINIWRIIFEATEKTQTPFLRRALEDAKIEEHLKSDRELKQVFLGIVKTLIFSPDKNTDKSLIFNFLYDIDDATSSFNKNFRADISYLRANLEFHSANFKYYFTHKDTDIYCDTYNVVEDIIDSFFSETEFYLNKADRFKEIHIKILLKYYQEIIQGYSNKDHLSPMIKRVQKRLQLISRTIKYVTDEPDYKTLNVISLRGVNIAMRKILPLLISKYLFEDHKRVGDDSKYLNIIVDEAHNILSSMSERESQQWKDYRLETFEEIIKEGRKFGVFMTIASQRPYDISQTIISQLHNYFLHRLINNNDINAIERTVSYLDKVSFDSLSILPTGTCIIAGTIAPIPVIVEIDEIDESHKPYNKTIELLKHWED